MSHVTSSQLARRTLGGFALLGLFVGLCTAVGLGTFVLLDVDEPRFVTASRTMFEGGDLLVPWFNGAERFDKPILIYWLQLAAMHVFGPNEFAARLPSTLAIVVAALSTAGIARLLGFSLRSALLAGFALGAAALPQVMGRAATADAVLLGTTTACALFQWRLARWPGAGAWSHFGAWTCLALAVLTKGPPAVVAPAALGIGLLWQTRSVSWRAFGLGLVWAVALVLAWWIPALLRTDGRFWTEGVLRHVVERSLRPFEGHGGFEPWWYLFYFVVVPAIFLPFSPFLLRGIGREGELLAAGTRRPLWVWLLGTVLVFTVVTSKLPHYPMPALPALALLVAAYCSEGRARRHSLDPTIVVSLVVLGLLFAAVMIIAYPLTSAALHARGEPAGPIPATALVAAGAALGLLLTSARMLNRGRPAASLLLAGAASLLGFALMAGGILPDLSRRMLAHELAQQPRLLVSAEKLWSWELVMPSAVYYLRRDIERFEPLPDRGTALEQLYALIERPGHYVLTRRSKMQPLYAGLATLAPERAARLRAALDAPVASFAGILPSKGRVVRLEVLGL